MAKEALKELLYFAYMYDEPSSAVTLSHYRNAMIRVICHKKIGGDWHEVSNEKLFTKEPSWSVGGVIPPSSAAHIQSVLSRAKQTLNEIEADATSPDSN